MIGFVVRCRIPSLLKSVFLRSHWFVYAPGLHHYHTPGPSQQEPLTRFLPSPSSPASASGLLQEFPEICLTGHVDLWIRINFSHIKQWPDEQTSAE
jgi:hypothetical protein